MGVCFLKLDSPFFILKVEIPKKLCYTVIDRDFCSAPELKESFMIRREIKEMLFKCEGVEGYAITLPETLYSILSELGMAEGRSFDFEKITLPEMTFSCSFVVEEISESKYSYLRLRGVRGACSVEMNGARIAELSGERENYLLDLGNNIKMGENTLSFTFAEPEGDFGILSPVQILRFDNAIIDTVKLKSIEIGEAVTVKVELTTVGNNENSRGVATLISGSGHIYYGGFMGGVAEITVRDPLLWLPKGMGVQNVYKLAVNLYGDLEVEDSAEMRVGLCNTTLDSDREKLLVNGQTFLPMGAVYIPEKGYNLASDRRRTAAYVTSSAMAGFNCFVVREKMPSDSFFDLCDVHGISVIFETDSISESVLSAISGVAHHPSFAMVEFIGLSDKKSEITEKMKEIAPVLCLSFKDKAPTYFGEPSIPEDSLLYRFVSPSDRNVLSPVMEKHSDGRCEEIAANVARGYLYPSNPSDFAYLSRLSQAENYKKETFERRRAFGDRGRAIFSSVSSERLISDSTLDLDAGWKAAHYYAAEFFSPIAIDAEIFGTQVTFNAYNNKPTAAFGKLEYRIIDSECNLVYKNIEDVEIEESSGKKIFTRDFTEYVGANPGDRVIEYIFTDAAGLSFRDSKPFSDHKSFEYKSPKIKAEIAGSDRRFSVTLTSEAYAGAVELCFTDTPAVFSDNYFDITTKAPVKIDVSLTELPETLKNLKKQLKIRCINEIGRN